MTNLSPIVPSAPALATVGTFLYKDGPARLLATHLFNTKKLQLKMVKAVAVVRGDSKVNGTVTFEQASESAPTTVTFDIKGLEPSKKVGFHIHQFGDVSNGCISTGPHWNSDRSTPHGAPTNPDEKRHLGDLGNITANDAGEAKSSVTDKLVSVLGATSVIGRAVVVHAGEDDLGLGGHPDSLKTGNAGGRAACGIIGLSSA